MNLVWFGSASCFRSVAGPHPAILFDRLPQREKLGRKAVTETGKFYISWVKHLREKNHWTFRPSSGRHTKTVWIRVWLFYTFYWGGSGWVWFFSCQNWCKKGRIMQKYQISFPLPKKSFCDQLRALFPKIDIIWAMVIVWRVRGKIIRSVLYNSVQQLCTVQCTHIWTDLTVLWIGFCLIGPISLCVDSFFVYVLFCVHCMHA